MGVNLKIALVTAFLALSWILSFATIAISFA